ncbi:MAG: patatin-like phospholipase family protein [Microcoleus sp.]
MTSGKELVNNMYVKPANSSIGIVVKQLPIENLVFEGGGPKGLVYVGAIKVLEEEGILANIKNVGGSSAGAMTALAIGLGYSAEKIKRIVYDANIADFTDLTDGNSPPIIFNVTFALKNLLFGNQEKGGGIFLGNKLQKWVRGVIAERLEASSSTQWTQVAQQLKNDDNYQFTFWQLNEFKKWSDDRQSLDLGIKTICFTGTNYTTGELEVFSFHRTPDMPVDLAVRISMSLPWFFQSVKYNGQEYIDGGCLNNYPMFIFNEPPYFLAGMNKVLTGVQGVYSQNLCTLGLKVDSQDEIKKLLWEGGQQNPQSWLGKLRDKIINKLVGVNYIDATKEIDREAYEKHPQRTIQISDLNYGTFNFNLAEEDKDALAESGKKATLDWLQLYYNDAGIEIEVNSRKQLREFYSLNNFSSDDIKAVEQQFDSVISTLRP